MFFLGVPAAARLFEGPPLLSYSTGQRLAFFEGPWLCHRCSAAWWLGRGSAGAIGAIV